MVIQDWDRPDPIIDDAALPVAVSPHPRALLHFSIARFFERIAHYGTRSFLIFYMIDRFGNQNVTGNYETYGILAALVVFSQIPGGLIVDIGMGRKTAVTWGGLSLAVGYFVLAFGNSATDAIGFLCIFAGMGIYGPAMFTSLAQFYRGRKVYLGAGMAYHFAGIYAGGMAALVLVGGLAASVLSWRQGFMVCGISMMIGQVYLLAFAKAFNEPLLKTSTPPMPQHDFKQSKHAFPTYLTIGLIAAYAVFWISHHNQYDLLNQLIKNGPFIENFSGLLQFFASAIAIVVLFTGAMVLTNRPGNALDRIGKGILINIAALAMLWGGLQFVSDALAPGFGLMMTAVLVVLWAFAEFLIAPSLYTYILAGKQKYPNMLLGFISAAAYLPALVYLFPGSWLHIASFSGIAAIAGTAGLTAFGFWLLQEAKKQ